ncbi:phytanoyl-CoA dioxygenase [Niveispirillum sp. SYP-B3756]|uniref:phytanoyl-CoA dioxygenase family protein n=1 Tax=Niveispirillum sp. SYP-B3756 TaxID=2662178 RepID=UPI001290F348|nr:phytanoyl-CoA dioxygenase family protein [Niveispirillum sp. SYP-B3756]MQP67167.1 phytanoyl-CoA dioxygenase [Niveispirillum sp. SYP-B3756]
MNGARWPEPAAAIGALHVPALIGLQAVAALCEGLAPFPLERPGLRLGHNPLLSQLLGPDGAVGVLAGDLLGQGARPVRALLFDKTAQTNWQVAWHQDRTIAVNARHDVPGFGPWSVKTGIPHVAPPVEILAGMVTIRLHLDDVGPDNAPLLIASGSHRLGMVAEADIASVVAATGHHACLAQAGDAWAYATLILHASEVARQPTRRRVLHVDYAATALPPPLEWQGIQAPSLRKM